MLPHPASSFDFAISVAVVHHLSTRSRRIQAISAILHTLRRSSDPASTGKALICVWALEQKHSRRGWSEGDEQDTMVPWVMKGTSARTEGSDAKTFYRYYHLYRSGELQQDITAAGGTTVDAGYEKDNWWAIAVPEIDNILQA